MPIFWEIIEKNIANLLSGELAQRIVIVNISEAVIYHVLLLSSLFGIIMYWHGSLCCDLFWSYACQH